MARLIQERFSGTQKLGSLCEIWENWCATYGRNGCGGRKTNPEKQDYIVRYGKTGVRHMGEMGAVGGKTHPEKHE